MCSMRSTCAKQHQQLHNAAADTSRPLLRGAVLRMVYSINRGKPDSTVHSAWQRDTWRCVLLLLLLLLVSPARDRAVCITSCGVFGAGVSGAKTRPRRSHTRYCRP
ncbi:hypothetical protein M441DRAFT_235173 [Trichoderma asperellum CBS 433.97]|uniref:Uncharacterized protein n=1 Tax=Trichoderma asperellum (strain ATCC 204424 / CBS 433.97 / NBRC 101777) TaxID=1042311 RepID=A0A2T3Z154_TRIA4|nr:hypothetical protein M441DRAFT_235173 [Trichoderma asperellum CBS 433.97]PTB38535.1 hypothetical protein M441DRAFT_235173 [Trichoderma asperellum CBS 433.97]